MNGTTESKDAAHAFLGPVVVAALAVTASAWVRLDPASAVEALAAYRSGLYLQPWRVVTSGFIHFSIPHLAFNVVTLWLIGTRVVWRHGTLWFGTVFVISLGVGQVVHSWIGPSYVYGISGGVCGLYGFLVQREWSGDFRRLIRGWFVFWAYPLALLALLVADRLGLMPVANVNHAASMAVGWLIARGTAPGATRIWRAAAVLPVSIALLSTAYRPWDMVWRAVRGIHDPGTVLSRTPCDTTLALPGPGLASAPAEVVTLLNTRRIPIRVEYFSEDGDLVESFRTTSAMRSFVPLRGSVWRITEQGGPCVQQFVASRSGVVLIE